MDGVIRPRTTTKLAPRDGRVREIQAILNLVRPDIPRGRREVKYDGYCGSACEAYLHLAGGRDAKLKVKQHSYEGGSHWWLEDSKGRVIDLTLGPDDHRYFSGGRRKPHPYERGKG